MSTRSVLLFPAILVLFLQACDLGGGKPQVLRLREVIGTIEVAASESDELQGTDTDRGVQVMSAGALLRLPEGARVRLEFLHRRGYLYYYGPGELEVMDTRLVKGQGGIHDKAKEVHATLFLRGGVLAGAMEGSLDERPSIEVATETGSTQLEATGKFAVMQLGGSKRIEAWVRDDRGPESLRILLASGGAVDFPINGIFLVDDRGPPSDRSVDRGSSTFTRSFLERLSVDPGALPEVDRMIDALQWRSDEGF